MKKLCTLIYEVVPRFEYKAPGMMNGNMLVYSSDAQLLTSDLSSILPVVNFDEHILLVHIDPEKYIIPDKNQMHIKIHNIVCEYFGITSHEIRERTRKREIMIPRQLACHLTWKFCRGVKTLAKIGDYYNGLDHATVLHSSRVIDDLLEVGDKEITEHYVNLYKLITEKINTHEETSSTNKTSLMA